MEMSNFKERRERVAQVFRFLQALDQVRNPVKRLVRDQVWHIWAHDLPQHPSISLPVTIRTESAATDTASDDTLHESNYVLRVTRPKLTSAPAPPTDLLPWLKPSWDDVGGTVQVHPERRVEDRFGNSTIQRFNEERHGPLLRRWQKIRDEWAAEERGARIAHQVYERLYTLHSQLTREGERLELVLGDGILNWRRPDGGVHHPLLLQRLQLEFDAEHQEFTVVEADYPVEFYSALFQGLTDVSGQLVAQCQGEVNSGDLHPLDTDRTAKFLGRLASELHVDGEFLGHDIMVGERDHPRITRTPVFFVRTRTLGFTAALEHVLSDLPQTGELPNSLLNVIGVEPLSPSVPEPGPSSSWSASEDEAILFSKPANQEQLAIAKRLERYGSVLVQGPPGTGKTHTISNLIGHLLAQGKRVLVTSHTTKALRVLREQVVEPLQPLCVSVLDRDLDSRKQLEDAVSAIVERLSSSDAYQLEHEASRLAKRRGELIAHLRELRQELLEARSAEYRDILIAGASFSPAEAARRVATGRELHDWIPSPVEPGEPLPLSEQEVFVLYESNRNLTPEDECELALRLPSLQDLVSPDAFDELVEEAKQLGRMETCYGEQLWQDSGTALAPEELEQLLEQAFQAIAPLREAEGWQLEVMAAGYAGDLQRKPWETLMQTVRDVQEQAAQTQEAILNYGPTLAEEITLEEQGKALDEIVSHLESGRNLNALTLFLHRDWKRIKEKTRVREREPSQLEHFQVLQAVAKIELARQRLKERWNRQMATIGAPSLESTGRRPEDVLAPYLGSINKYLEWYESAWRPFELEMERIGLKWKQLLTEAPPRFTKHGNLLGLIDVVEQELVSLFAAKVDSLRWQKVQRKLAHLQQHLSDWDARNSTAPPENVVSILRRSVVKANTVGYRAAYGRLAELHAKASAKEQRQQLLTRLSRIAPQWASAIRQREVPHHLVEPPGDVQQAWTWRQLNDELVRRDKVSLDELQRRIEHAQGELRETTAQLIDHRAWAAQVRRTTVPQRQALVGWMQTVRKIGKGYGKRVPHLQAQARRLMNQSRTAVPVWIMPLSRVVENFEPGTSNFDVVIIDEASQSDALGLIAFYMAKQVIVVGDDQQVSPTAVGQNLDQVQQLIDIHLQGVPNAHLYDGQYSVYDIAMSCFGGTISLREHFRCVPEIIRFSNYLSYNGSIKPLRDTSGMSVTPPVVEYQVKAATRDGKVNEAEAQAVASLLIAATEQPEYAKSTFGVISLVGTEQAERIDFLLRSHLQPVEYERRRVVCGNAAHFQGDERDVMFLSVVDAPQDGPLRMQQRADYKQRLNVAVSRSKDQVWVVHSLQTSLDLQAGDLRRRLLEFARNPQALKEQHEAAEARTESDFERQVLQRLVSAGYRVTPQWKVGAYRIDLVVEGTSSRLAVECDGDRYHDLDKLPEDMERQAILERLGWTFVRIRGSNFYRDPERAMEPVFARLRTMGIEALGVEHAKEVSTHNRELKQQVLRRAAELRREWNGGEELSDAATDSYYSEVSPRPTTS